MEVATGPQPLTAEIIAVGDELTSGQRLDTNSQWLAKQLGDMGIRSLFHSTVADHVPAKIDVFQAAVRRADIIVVTGGLGPTADDLTRQVIAQIAGVELELDPGSLEHIRNLFKSFGRKMTENNIVQAQFPRGSRVIANPYGSAPGIDIDFQRPEQRESRLFALPGVPAEMKQMWEQTVRPAIEQMLPAKIIIRQHTVHCFGRGESEIEKMLPDLIRRGREPQVGITASQATITFRIVATDVSEQNCIAKISETESLIREKLGVLVFGSGDDQLQDVLVNKLNRLNRRVAIVDCATDGLIARLIRSAENLGSAFAGGVSVAGSAEIDKFLNVEFETSNVALDRSQQLKILAQATKQKFDCDCAIVADAHQPPQDASGGQSSSQIAIVIGESSYVDDVPIIGHPAIREIRFAKYVLNQLRLKLS